ncbi:MAG: esterase family protein [Planctomycetaceae bacterium]|nr:esterase family protein [Planctomycetaceae bacterium]
MTSPTEPRHLILRSIDDMGAFIAEYPGNATYWIQVIFSRLGGCCVLGMGIMSVSGGHWALANVRKANPGEIPDYFYPVVWGMMTVFPVAILLFFIYAIHRNRKNPLIYGLYEKGYVVVCRNKTYRRVFWDSISRIRVRTQGRKKPRILGMVMEISTPEQWVETRQEFIFSEFFHNGEQLCQHVLDSAPHAETMEKPNITRRQHIMILIAFVLVIPTVVLFQHFLRYIKTRSAVSKDWQIESQITGGTMHFAFYLPPGYQYDNSGRKYPVLYLFHGFRDNHTSWLDHGELRRIADETIRSGKALPMVIIMPHTPGGFYGNGFDGRNRYEDYFFTELIPFVEKHFRVRPGKEHRAIAGISMGGQGAFYYAMKYPELFASCCPMGGAFHFTDLDGVQPGREIVDGNPNDLGVLLQKTAELRLAEKQLTPDSDERQDTFVRFYFDCGEQDGLIKINRDLDAKMQELDIPHEFRTRPGGHDWQCWQGALPEVLEFVSGTLTQ